MKRVAFACLLVASLARADAPPAFEFRDGDRVVLIGDTLIERDQESGYLETLLTIQNPAKNLTFRNLGWSGDTVHGDARAGFGKQPDGLKHLIDHVRALKPTVLIVGYGMTDSFDGERGLARFEAGLDSLLEACTGPDVRVILLGPIAHEKLAPPLPDPEAHNRDLDAYRRAIAAGAAGRHAFYIDLRRNKGGGASVTDDGIHPTSFGYWRLARTIAGALNPADSTATRFRLLLGPARIETIAMTLPAPLPPRLGPNEGKSAPLREWRYFAHGLKPGQYTLRIDGAALVSADADRWARGVEVRKGPEFDQVEELRKTINAKNLLYFYRWRPQNETYLFGFRKHEQGVNAREIPLFDPLVEEKERTIARLRQPQKHVYELVRESEAAQ